MKMLKKIEGKTFDLYSIWSVNYRMKSCAISQAQYRNENSRNSTNPVGNAESGKQN